MYMFIASVICPIQAVGLIYLFIFACIVKIFSAVFTVLLAKVLLMMSIDGLMRSEGYWFKLPLLGPWAKWSSVIAIAESFDLDFG